MTEADNEIDFWQKTITTPCQHIEIGGVKVVVKRDDLNHSVVQGNKLRKLKYNLQAAKQKKSETIITFGGAYSNHLLATAFAAQKCGFKSVGVVRGHELANNPKTWSKTLLQCKKLGMQLVFISRTEYRLKTQSAEFIKLIARYPNHYVIPEGGSNQRALGGVAEIIAELNQQLNAVPTHLFCPVGTGGTVAGLIKGVADANWSCKVCGIVVLKGLHSVKDDINQWLTGESRLPDYEIIGDYHGGGYAKNNTKLNRFSVNFEQQHTIKLDKIYNSKSFYALAQMIYSGQITMADRPLIIHTGGLQGGVNQ